ncbi:MAG: ATP-binding cassette domain-containing protein [Alphaproteobacteria bacterium]
MADTKTFLDTQVLTKNKSLVSPSLGTLILATIGLNFLALALPVTILQVYDRIIPNAAIDTLWVLVGGVIVALIFDGLLRQGRSGITSWTAARFEHICNCRAMARVLNSNLVTLEKDAPGVYLDRFKSIDQLKDLYSGQLALTLIDLPFAALFLGLILYLGGWLVLVPILLFIPFAIIAAWGATRVRAAIEQRNALDDRRYNFIIEVLLGLHTVKGMAMEAQMLRRYERLQESSARSVGEVTFFNGINQGMMALFAQATMAAVVGFGSLLVLEGQLTSGGLAACTLLAGRSLQPVLRGFGFLTAYQAINLSRKRVDHMLKLPSESQSGHRELPQYNGEVTFEGVRFGYADREIIGGIDLRVTPGEVISISGENGAGKTTLLLLAMGLIQPVAGRVLYDGQDIAALDPGSLRKHVAYLPQNGVMFQGTILENLTMFQGGDAVDEAMHFSRLLGLDQIINRLPRGYDTPIGGGSNEILPGGARQRIAIARALIGRPKLILFDEANTSLDSASDEFLKNTLLYLKGRHTMILVSHRPSLLRLADRSFILTNGRLVSQTFSDIAASPASVSLESNQSTSASSKEMSV